eukprot:3552025-Amphidinium_carterae.2
MMLSKWNASMARVQTVCCISILVLVKMFGDSSRHIRAELATTGDAECREALFLCPLMLSCTSDTFIGYRSSAFITRSLQVGGVYKWQAGATMVEL